MWEESTVASEQPPWHPDPGWIELPSRGLSGSGLWLAQSAGRPWVVKRLTRPLKGDPAPLSQPKHFGYWRREADVALEASLQRTPGLRAPEVLRVDEDDEGVSVWQAVVDQAPTSGLFRAQALGRFSKADLEPRHVALEQTIYVQNFQTAQILGAARGAAIAAAALYGKEIFEYAPLRVKQAVVGAGRASKEQIQRTVAQEMGLAAPPEPPDVADAMAIALTHYYATLRDREDGP